MNYIDIIIISVILFFVLKGILKGFARELMGILSFVVSFAVLIMVELRRHCLPDHMKDVDQTKLTTNKWKIKRKNAEPQSRRE